MARYDEYVIIDETTTMTADTDYGPYLVADWVRMALVRKITTGATLSLTIKYGNIDANGNLIGSEETVALADGEEITLELAASGVACKAVLITIPDTTVVDYLALNGQFV